MGIWRKYYIVPGLLSCAGCCVEFGRKVVMPGRWARY